MLASLKESCDKRRQHVKNRDITLRTKVHLVKTVVLEKPLQNPLDCKEIKQLILRKINPEYSLEGLMLTLKLQYFGHLI